MLLLILVPVIELAVFWFFSYMFGLVITIILVFSISAVGIFLSKRQGTSCWIEFNRQVDNGETPKFPAMNGMLILFAAALLIVPGLLSDFCGILLLFPFVRTIIIEHLTLQFEKYRKKTKYKNDNNNSDNVIDIS
jgi:UPF0716 protein FxsA